MKRVVNKLHRFTNLQGPLWYLKTNTNFAPFSKKKGLQTGELLSYVENVFGVENQNSGLYKHNSEGKGIQVCISDYRSTWKDPGDTEILPPISNNQQSPSPKWKNDDESRQFWSQMTVNNFWFNSIQ